MALVAFLTLVFACGDSFAQPAAKERVVEIELGTDGILVDGAPLDAAQLEAYLRALTPSPGISVRAGRNVDFKDVVAVLDVLKRANATKVSLDTQISAPPSPDTDAGLDIDFPGGNLGQLLDLLNREKNGRFNLILDQVQREFPLPAFNVRNANARSLTEALNVFLRPTNLRIVSHTPQNMSAEAVFALQPIEQPRGPIRVSRANEFKTYSLRTLPPPYTPDHVANALRTAWELDPTHDPQALKIKYHPESGLLFVVGPDGAAINLADQILTNLLSADLERAERERRVAAEIQRRRALRDASEAAQPEAAAPQPQP